ncbi:Hypothetical protein PHPALM_644 [Phytophthora palmivora]|uniref:Transmembrane protein n=1 Tax=Phytophthora palmivora TaxID=4796 RepID=A0A2P4YUB9_9STRA|nr:Hypothetical protein PHPALM_644 [Phytophthora palmivora]
MPGATVIPPSFHHDSLNTHQSSRAWLWKCQQTWKQLQVSYYGGKYSVHRVLALDQYKRTTSFTRLLLTCIGTPLPTVVFVLIQESIPLQDPNAGWRENYGFWIRAAILAFVISLMVSDQTRFLINGVILSRRQMILVSVCASCAFIMCATTIVANVTFPVPFFAIVMSPLFYLLLLMSYRIVAGSSIWREILQHQDQFIRFITFVFTEVMIAATYPAYEMLFRLAEGSRYQLLVIVLLPIIKVVAKNIVMRCMVHMEDMVPEAVIFTVDFFNAIYIASCMQSATSDIAIAAMAITDLSQTILIRTVTISTKLRAIVGNNREYDMIIAVCFLCRDLEMYEKQCREHIRVNSCFPHKLSCENKALLESLAKIPIECRIEHDMNLSTRGPGSSSIMGAKVSHFCVRNKIPVIHRIVPEPTSSNLLVSAQSTPSCINDKSLHNSPLASRNTILRETLEVLFSIECLVVTAYLEAAIPFFYSTYIVIMIYLPSAQYHSEMNGITSENVGSKVLYLNLFGLLQVLSFVLLVSMIKRNCGMQAWCQLAFVLDTQMSLVQGKLVAWVVVTLCFRVVHFDFTFHFI